MFKVILIIVAMFSILKIIGANGTKETSSVTLPTLNSITFDSHDFQNLADQVEILSKLHFGFKKELTTLKTTIIQEIKEQAIEFKKTIDDCSNKNLNKESLPSSLVQELAELKMEIVEDIRATLVESRCNLSEQYTNSFENKILSSVSTSVKGEIRALMDSLTVSVKSDMENLRNIISEMKNEISDLRDSPSISLKSENDQLREIIPPTVNTITTANISQTLVTEEQRKFEDSFKNNTNKSAQPYKSCVEALQYSKDSGIYKLHLPASGLEPFDVYCLRDPENGTAAWTVLQRRQDGSVDFYRNWQEYKIGFGNLTGEFFLGLEKWHALTNQMKPQQLWIELADWEGDKRSARYTTIQIGNETSKYNLRQLGQYSGDAGDSLSYHRSMKFSTQDSDNDADENDNCATYLKGAWWFRKCHHSHLNGEYLRGDVTKYRSWYGINWYHWGREFYSLKYTQMAIRPNN